MNWCWCKLAQVARAWKDQFWSQDSGAQGQDHTRKICDCRLWKTTARKYTQPFSPGGWCVEEGMKNAIFDQCLAYSRNDRRYQDMPFHGLLDWFHDFWCKVSYRFIFFIRSYFLCAIFFCLVSLFLLGFCSYPPAIEPIRLRTVVSYLLQHALPFNCNLVTMTLILLTSTGGFTQWVEDHLNLSEVLVDSQVSDTVGLK